MKKYVITALTLNGEFVRICPIGCYTNKDEMLKIAKRMKYEMPDYYKNVELLEDVYKYVKTNSIKF